MRTSLSCASCRKAKVKCLHQGTSPCERCIKTNSEGCALTETRVRSATVSRKQQKRKRPTAAINKDIADVDPNDNNDNVDDSGNNDSVNPTQQAHIGSVSERRNEGTADGSPARRQRRVQTHDHTSRARPRSVNSSSPSPVAEKAVPVAQVEVHLSSLKTSTIVQVVKGFTSRYPELAMIHLPTLLKGFGVSQGVETPQGAQGQKICQQEYRVLMAAILAAYMASGDQASHNELYERSVYEGYAEKLLSNMAFTTPHMLVAQALLIMALLKGSSFDLHKAWMYCGSAIRTMQFCYGARRASVGNDSQAISWAERHARVIESRTFWSCFNVSSMIDLGTLAQPLLPFEELERMNLLHPLNNFEFALGMDTPAPVSRIAASGPSSMDPGTEVHLWNVSDGFEIISRGIVVWSQAMTFIRNDGRRAPGMCREENCPWSPTSLWSSISGNLEGWRARQHPALHYPTQSIAAHSAVGNGETFLFVNIIYYLSVILLHREYFPFLPVNESEPRGPIEYQLEAQAPPGWWHSSACRLFNATSSVAHLLQESSECGILLNSPFTGFCAFIGAYMNLYVTQFPQMNLGQSTNSRHEFDLCYIYLKEFRKTWLLGEGWIKTIQSASLLYNRFNANDRRWMTKSSQDFSTLHQSIHEFFGPDKSQQHLQEINRASATLLDAIETCLVGMDQGTIDQPTMFNSLFFNLSGEFDTHHFWPS